MASILPKEETIIDPLYEPLKLNRYELCPHLTMLSNVSHLRYGFSPYLLFDVEGWKEVVKAIKGIDNDEKINSILGCEDFPDKLEKYLEKLEKLPEVEKEDRNKRYRYLKETRKDIKEEHKEIENKYRTILNEFLDDSTEFKENFGKIAHLFQLEYPVEVKCPERGKSQVTEQFMCEEGKIYSMKEALLRTFELRRARWLQMSGSLHIIHRSATHTRLAHQIGSMVAGVNALREIDVYPCGNMSMSLGEYLLMRGELHEFLMANFLHDIGHSPLSHVLEPNPFIELDHEEITRNLILGGIITGGGEEEMDWYVAERYLLKMKTIKDFEHRFFENRYDPIYNVGEKVKWEDEECQRGEFLNYLENNDEMLESEIVTVNEVLENFSVDTGRVIEILSGKMFCPNCGRLLEIEDNIVKCDKCEVVVDIEKQKIYDTQFLNKLIESEVDLDRMDHVKRDSVVCGLSLISFRLLELLGSMSVVLPDSEAYKEIHNMENKKPCILISEDGLLYVMDLLTARKSVFKDVLYSDENNWINGVVNQITALAVRYLPHIMIMLPFITDQILMHFYINSLFFGTQIEKLNKLFHGKMGYSGYGVPMRYKLIGGAIVTEDNLKGMYNIIEEINDDPQYEKLELPAVVFYTNIKSTKCPVCRGKNLEEVGGTYKHYPDMKVVRCEECEYKYLAGVEEDIFKLSECPICGGKIKKRKDFQDFIECDVCGKMRKWAEESWSPIFVYGKKFKVNGKKKYLKFKDLAGNYKETSRERFPERPSELDVKNLFYVWVSVFCDESRIMNVIESKISARGKVFDEVFIDLSSWEGV